VDFIFDAWYFSHKLSFLMNNGFQNKIIDLILKSASSRWRLRSFILFVIVVPILVAMIFSYVRQSAVLTDLAVSRRASIVELAADTLHERFDRLVDVGVAFADNATFKNMIADGNWVEASESLSKVVERIEFVDRIFITDSSGTLKSDTPALAGGVREASFSFRDWYQGVSEEWHSYVSKVYQRTAIPRYNVVAVAVPINLNDVDDIGGILVLQIELDRFLEWTRNIEVGSEADISVIDHRGNIAVHPDVEPQDDILSAGVIFNRDNVSKAMSDVRSGVSGFVSTNGSLMFYHAIDEYGWSIFLEESKSSVFAFRNRNLLTDGIVYVALFVIGLLLTMLIASMISRLEYQRKREESFLSSIGDGVVAIDKEFNVILWNKAAEQLTGWSKEDALGSKLQSVLTFVRAYDRKTDYTFIEETILFGRVHHLDEDTLLVRKDSTEIPTGDSSSPILDENGEVVGAIIVFRDTSMEREARMMESEFSYASHQLRTPLSKAMWECEAMLEKSKDERYSGKIETIYNALKTMNKLVEEVIEVSKIDAKTVVFSPKKVNLVDIVNDVVSSLEPLADVKGVDLSLDSKLQQIELNTDPDLLKNTLLEVVENSVHYTNSGGKVTIEFDEVDEYVLIKIVDDGIGVPESQKPLVFKKFFRGENVSSDEVIGVGLGLYIAREYVTLIGGRIWFEPNEIKGTTFYIQLPKE